MRQKISEICNDLRAELLHRGSPMREQPGVLAVHLIGPARTGRLWIQKWETHPAMAMITSHLSLSIGSSCFHPGLCEEATVQPGTRYKLEKKHSRCQKGVECHGLPQIVMAFGTQPSPPENRTQTSEEFICACNSD
jgi:hypothetical protein